MSPTRGCGPWGATSGGGSWATSRGRSLAGGGFFRESAFDASEFRGHVKVKKMVVTPRTGDAGWGGKIARGIVNLADRLRKMGTTQAGGFLAGCRGGGGAGAR